MATEKQLLDALMAVRDEVSFAREKFPANAGLFAALVEEVGELARELLINRDAERGDPSACAVDSAANIRLEASHVACVAVRIMLERDGEYEGVGDEFFKLVGVVGGLARRLLATENHVSQIGLVADAAMEMLDGRG